MKPWTSFLPRKLRKRSQEKCFKGSVLAHSQALLVQSMKLTFVHPINLVLLGYNVEEFHRSEKIFCRQNQCYQKEIINAICPNNLGRWQSSHQSYVDQTHNPLTTHNTPLPFHCRQKLHWLHKNVQTPNLYAVFVDIFIRVIDTFIERNNTMKKK